MGVFFRPLCFVLAVFLVPCCLAQCFLSIDAELHYACAQVSLSQTNQGNTTRVCWGNTVFQDVQPVATIANTYSILYVGKGYEDMVTYCGFLLEPPTTISCFGTNDSSIAQLNSPPGIYQKICVGGSHACALSSTNGIACWGNNDYGQAKPPALASRSKLIVPYFSEIYCGYDHTCGMRDDGYLVCWGSNEDGQSNIPQFQIGGFEYTPQLPPGVFMANRPAIAQVSLGWYHSCAVLIDSTAVCWGINAWGQCDVPSDIQGYIATISASYDFTCALTVDGNATCWGRNNRGQSAIPTTICNPYEGLGAYVPAPPAAPGAETSTTAPPITPPPTPRPVPSLCSCSASGCICPPLVLDFVQTFENFNSGANPSVSVCWPFSIIIAAICLAFTAL